MSNLILPSSPFAGTSPRPIHRSSGALGLQPCFEPVPDHSPTQSPANTVASTPPAPSPSPRCSVKGCVFPATAAGQMECHYHGLLRTEAKLFQSHQPSHLLLLHAPLVAPEQEPDDSRQRDRKRQAAEREVFILDEPA
jgi:hypothetical protein